MMAETEQLPIVCPYCGSKRVRLSTRQSHRRPVEIYRCSSCKRHFKIAAANASKSFNISSAFVIGGVVIGVLVAITIGTVWMLGMGESERQSSGDTSITSAIDPKTPAPAAGTDMDSQYKRALYFWTAGNYPEAFPWLKSSADKGHAEARYYLGLAYLYGRGTIQNFHLAFEQIQASARQHFLNAQYQLGLMYRDSLGTPESREQAYIWLNIAASRGHSTATFDRDKLALSMSADEIARAQDGTLKELAKMGDTAAPAAQRTTALMTKTTPEPIRNPSRESDHE